MLVATVACQSEKRPSARAPVASCDVVDKTMDGETHSCTDVFDAELVASQETFCNELRGATFAKGKPCATEARLGGCVEPNGTIRWTYKGTETCANGLKFKGGTPPKLGAVAAYRCGNATVCIEEKSALDLEKTGMKARCGEVGGTFAVGACPTENVVARCALRERSGDSIRVYYAPGATADGAKEDCEQSGGALSGP
jgi:hypothetical protein